jgi:hypothetical protein
MACVRVSRKCAPNCAPFWFVVSVIAMSRQREVPLAAYKDFLMLGKDADAEAVLSGP